VFTSLVNWIHPNPLVAPAVLLVGLVLGLALAFSDWRSKLTIGSIIGTAVGSLGSVTVERVAVLQQVLDSSGMIKPLLLGLSVAFASLLIALVGGAAIVFAWNYVEGKRAGDPEAFLRAGRRGFTIFSTGLHSYTTASPDLVAANEITDLRTHQDVRTVLFKTLLAEAANPQRSEQHFRDVMESTARLVLMTAFGEKPDLQHFRLAFFRRTGARLEYQLTVNNRDWTAHSMRGFDEGSSFVGSALKEDRPLVYPRDKKRRSYEKRKASRYKSFVAMPVPCGEGTGKHVGAITVDYTGAPEAFTERRIETLFSLAQLFYAFYLMNVEGKSP